MMEKKACIICGNDKNNVYLINHNNQNNYYCEESVKDLNYNIFLKPVCIPKFTLLLQNNKYFVLKISVLTVFVDKDDKLFIRGDWEDESNYNTDNYYEKDLNYSNRLFLQISDDNTVFVYNFNKGNAFSNKSHIYLLLGSAEGANNFVFPEDSFNINSFMDDLKDLNSYTYFSYCFHLLFSLIYSGILFFIDINSCFKGCSKICINGLHFFYDLYKENHGSIEDLLNIDKFDEKKVFNEDYRDKKSPFYFFKEMSDYFLALRTRAFDEDSCGNFLESRRENILNLSKSLLNSIKKGFTEGFSNNSLTTEAKQNE